MTQTTGKKRATMMVQVVGRATHHAEELGSNPTGTEIKRNGFCSRFCDLYKRVQRRRRLGKCEFGANSGRV